MIEEREEGVMRCKNIIETILLLILTIGLTTSHAKDNPNVISFGNISGESAIVKLVGPTQIVFNVPNQMNRLVKAAPGEYYILVRYGESPEQYKYTKGETFTISETSKNYPTISIILHKVEEGKYDTHPISTHPTSEHEFNSAIPDTMEKGLNKTSISTVQKKLKELGYNPGPIDGLWGNKTEAALRAFQKKNNLPITGHLDDITFDKVLLAKNRVLDQNIDSEAEKLSSLNPWQSLFITEGSAPSGITIDGKVLQISVDLGKELSMEEIKILKTKVKLVDETGQEYHSSGYGSDKGYKAWSLDRVTGKKISWQAEFSIFFKFVVPSKTGTYTLYWNGFPPLEIGDPFVTPFMRKSNSNS